MVYQGEEDTPVSIYIHKINVAIIRPKSVQISACLVAGKRTGEVSFNEKLKFSRNIWGHQRGADASGKISSV